MSFVYRSIKAIEFSDTAFHFDDLEHYFSVWEIIHIIQWIIFLERKGRAVLDSGELNFFKGAIFIYI